MIGSIGKWVWNKAPDWMKLGFVLVTFPIFAFTYYKAWHIETIHSTVNPIKNEMYKDIGMIYQRQDDLQRSFNTLEANMNKNHQILLEAVLKKH